MSAADKGDMMTISNKRAFTLVILVFLIANAIAFTSDIDVNLFNTQTLPLPTGITELSTTIGYSRIVADRYNNHLLVSFLNYNRVFVYENSNDTWSILQELLPADTTDVSNFGNSISITENKIAVGSKRSQFHAFIYAFDGTQYSESQRLSVNPDEYSDFWAYWHAFTLELQSDNLIIGCDGINMCTYFLTLFYKNVNNSYQLQNYDEDAACSNISAENDIAVLSGKWHGDEPGPGEYRSGAYSYNGSIWEPDNTFSDGASMENIDWYSNIRNDRSVGVDGIDLLLLEHDGANWGILKTASVPEGLLTLEAEYSVQLNNESIMLGSKHFRYNTDDDYAIYSLKDTSVVYHCIIQGEDNENIQVLDNSFVLTTPNTLKVVDLPSLSANFETTTFKIDNHFGLKLKNASLSDYSVEWDLNNDGSIDSYMQNPIIEMEVTDEMDVRLTVYDETGNESHTIIKTVAIDKEDAGYYTRLDFYDWLQSCDGGFERVYDFASDFNANSDYIFARYSYNSMYDMGDALRTFEKSESWGISSINGNWFDTGMREHAMISNSKILFQGIGIYNDIERQFNYCEIGDDRIPVLRQRVSTYSDNPKTYLDIADNYSVAKQGESSLIFGEWQDSMFVDIQQVTVNGEINSARITDSHCLVSTFTNDSFYISVYKNNNNVWQLQNIFHDIDLTPQNYVSKSLGESILKYDDGFVVLQYFRTPYNPDEEYIREYHLLFFREMDSSWYIVDDLLIHSSSSYLPVSDLSIGICNRFLAHRDIEEESVKLYYKNWDGEWELIDALTNPEQPFDSGFGNQIVITDEDILISAPTQQLYDSQAALYVFPLDRLYVSNDDNEVSAPDLKGSLANYPNPFNPSTTFAYSIPESGNVEIAVYNLKGQKVTSLVNDYIEQGSHRILWEGKDSNNKNVSSGVYFYQLKLNGKALKTSKCVLLK